ncbi:hypothetical protein RvY_04659 [Ramazzottius varieornatus]|uniref:Guanylate cyclase domain-containing protein n=1 Tax=Ramazzottius varieornatus TaxID=947166 RepID=A0A1D1UY12_RAMVA|nr:hypothetical protein RvY_04659 [Ramazzottius varieornatus]
MRIHMTAATYELLRDRHELVIAPRGEIVVPGKGVMKTYWLDGSVGG